MSTDWHVHCRDCKETFTFNDANRMSEVMASLCKHAAAIAALAPLLREQPNDLMFAVGYSGNYGSIDPAWFAKHLGHRLVPISEYGDLLDQCTEYVDCVCGSRRRCTRDFEHEGDHALEPRS